MNILEDIPLLSCFPVSVRLLMHVRTYIEIPFGAFSQDHGLQNIHKVRIGIVFGLFIFAIRGFIRRREHPLARIPTGRPSRTPFMYGFNHHFNNQRFKHSQTIDDFSAAWSAFHLTNVAICLFQVNSDM